MSNQVSFTPYEIKDCLFDTERTKNLKRAICEQIKEGDVVLEAGGGTGILSMFALQCGAKHAYIIELSSRFCGRIRAIAKANGFEDKITIICGDACSTDVPEKVDLYISELLCTGLFFEPQIQAYNNLRRFFKEDTKCIPMGVTSTIALAHANTQTQGVIIDVDSYVASDVPHEILSEPTEYMEIHFNGQHINPKICNTGFVSIIVSDYFLCNSVVISTTAKLSPSIIAGATKFLFNPELIFVKALDLSSIERTNRSYMQFEIEYVAGCDTLDVKLAVW